MRLWSVQDLFAVLVAMQSFTSGIRVRWSTPGQKRVFAIRVNLDCGTLHGLVFNVLSVHHSEDQLRHVESIFL